MLSKLLRSRINKLILSLGIICILAFGSLIAKANTYGIQPFSLSESSVVTTYTQKTASLPIANSINENMVQSNGMKILIYSTHNNEKNIDSSIYDITEDLAQKLRRRGFIVEHEFGDYVGKTEYNKAYRNSGNMLLTKDLSSYSLVLDIHLDGTPNALLSEIKGKNIAPIMFPTTSENPFLQQETDIINGIKDNLSKFGDKIVRDNTTNYKIGIGHYNMSKSPNIILAEIGSDKNSFLECQYTNTYFASAINSYLTNK